jgi:transposase-like protein
MMQRGGQVVINLLANVKQKTIEPLIKDTIMPGTLVYTDEYSIYARLDVWGYTHKSVNQEIPQSLLRGLPCKGKSLRNRGVSQTMLFL